MSKVLVACEESQASQAATKLVPTDDCFIEMMRLSRKERERLFFLPPSKDRSKLRSKTYPGIVKAMAAQGGPLVDKPVIPEIAFFE